MLSQWVIEVSASETESGVDEWTVVQGRSEPSKTFRVLQRATVRTEAQATSTESPQQLTRDLVGARTQTFFKIIVSRASITIKW